MIKIGVFGGAFNPVHNGHINMVKEAFADLKLQKMLIIPTCVSPHKSNKGLSLLRTGLRCVSLPLLTK